MILNVYLCTFRDKIVELEKDFQRLSDEIKIPCKIIPKYSCIPQMNQHIAITYYGPEEIKKGYVRILFNRHYFDEGYNERKLTLIHELIHACQRTHELVNWNDFWLNTYDFLDKKRSKYVELEDHYNAYLAEDDRCLINQLHAWLFEIWDELFFRENYPELFDSRMNHLYNFIMKQTDFTKYDDPSIRREWIFVCELIRAYYLTSISYKTTSHKKFKILYETWLEKFELGLEKDEKTEWHAWLNKLTSFNKYPDSRELEQVYTEFANKLIQIK